MKTRCLVCENAGFKSLHDGILLRCESCGFVTANYDMLAFNPDKIYDETYFSGNEYEDYLRDKEVFIRNYNDRLTFIHSRDKNRSFNRVLELGCAYGFFGLALKERYPSVSYTGIDITPSPLEYGRTKLGLNLLCQDYLTFQPDAPYNEIFMWDVIEHLPSPDKFLEKAHSDLAEGGRLYLTTGDISAILPSIQGRRWRMIHPPSHLHYFSKRTISVLLRNKGFNVVSVSYPSVSRSLKQIYYSLFLLNRNGKSLHRNIHRLIPGSIRIPVNTFDIMLVIAAKDQKTTP